MRDLAGKAVLFNSRFQQFGRHHRRQGQGHDTGNGDRTGQGEGELPEQRTGQSALQADGGIDRRQGDGHGDDRADQFAGAEQGRIERRLALAQVALHVFDHHDGIVHHQTDRKHDGQQGQQVDGKTEDLHQEYRADQRQRDGHHRDKHRAKGTQEQENDDNDDQQGLTRVLTTSWMALVI